MRWQPEPVRTRIRGCQLESNLDQAKGFGCTYIHYMHACIHTYMYVCMYLYNRECRHRVETALPGSSFHFSHARPRSFRMAGAVPRYLHSRRTNRRAQADMVAGHKLHLVVLNVLVEVKAGCELEQIVELLLLPPVLLLLCEGPGGLLILPSAEVRASSVSIQGEKASQHRLFERPQSSVCSCSCFCAIYFPRPLPPFRVCVCSLWQRELAFQEVHLFAPFARGLL